jgi:hypothetical protein
LQRNASGDAQAVRVLGATGPGVLTGSVLGPMVGRRRAAPSTVLIPTIAGAAGVSVRLGAPFRVGSISASAVDRLASAGKLPAATPLKALTRR